MKMCKHKTHKGETSRTTTLNSTAATRLEKASEKDFGRGARTHKGKHMTNDTHTSDRHPKAPRGEGRHEGKRKGGGPRGGPKERQHDETRGEKGRGGRRRILGHGDLKYLLLELTAKTPRTGYDLMSEIETLSEGRYRPSPGVLYPAAELMRDMGWITDTEVDGKRVLSVTEDGLKTRTLEAAKIADITAKLTRTGERKRPDGADGKPHPRELMRRLKHVTRKKLEDDGSKEPAALAILAQALDKLEKI